MVVETGTEGKPLGEILERLGGGDWSYVECRCEWDDPELGPMDEFVGAVRVEGGNLVPLDGDSYSLGDPYARWEVGTRTVDGREERVLTVWKKGVVV